MGLGGIAVVALILVGATVSSSADTGEFVAEDPCTAAPDQFPGDGLDASVQRIALSALNGAACELGTTRERLVLSLDPNSSFDDVDWDHDTMEQALRDGAHRAIDDANDRDAIPGLVAAALGFVVDRAPDQLARRALADPRRLNTPMLGRAVRLGPGPKRTEPNNLRCMMELGLS